MLLTRKEYFLRLSFVLFLGFYSVDSSMADCIDEERAEVASILFDIDLQDVNDEVNCNDSLWGAAANTDNECDGYRGGHAGLDIQTVDVAGAASVDRDFYSLFAGEVIATDVNNGKISVYDEDNDRTIIYLHAREIYVSDGDEVEVGTALGVQGDEGWATGEHVHVEVRAGEHENSGCGIADTVDPETLFVDADDGVVGGDDGNAGAGGGVVGGGDGDASDGGGDTNTGDGGADAGAGDGVVDGGDAGAGDGGADVGAGDGVVDGGDAGAGDGAVDGGDAGAGDGTVCDFEDVSPTDADEYQAITYLCENRIANGYQSEDVVGDTVRTFGPDTGISRAEFLKIVLEAEPRADAPENLTCTNTLFTDVSDTDWHCEYVTEGVGRTIIHGYTDGTFKPDNMVNRAEAMKIVHQTYSEGDVGDLESQYPEWYRGYLMNDTLKDCADSVFGQAGQHDILNSDATLIRKEMALLVYCLEH